MTVLEADIGLVDTRIVNDERIGDDRINGPLGACRLRLAHAIPDHLAAAEFYFFAVGGEVLLNFYEEFRIRQPDLIAGGRTKHVGIGRA